MTLQEPEYVRPQVATSQRTGVATGTHPLMVESIAPDGRTIRTFNPDLGLDEIAQAYAAGQLAKFGITDALMWAKKKFAREDAQIRELARYAANLDKKMKIAKRDPRAYRRYLEVKRSIRGAINRLRR